MNMSEILTRVDSLSDRSRLVTRSVEREETPVLTLVDTSERPCEIPDPLIQALLDKLPKPNTIWPIDDRAKWLKAAAMAFNLIYKTSEREEQQSPSPLKAIG
jgi:hypothetical protein